MKFVEDIMTGDLEVFRDFAKLMITLLTSLFPVYFAVLELLNVASKKNPFLIIFSVGVSISLLVSLLCFVFALLPLKGQFVPIDLVSVREFRDDALKKRRRYTIAGLITFLAALMLIVIQFILILYY